LTVRAPRSGRGNERGELPPATPPSPRAVPLFISGRWRERPCRRASHLRNPVHPVHPVSCRSKNGRDARSLGASLTKKAGWQVRERRAEWLILQSLPASGRTSRSEHLSKPQHRREFGIRLALGARPSGVLALVVRDGVTLAVLGCAIGIAGTYLAARSLSGFLFEVRPWDPATVGTVLAVVLAVATVACLIPGRRASAEDPARALRAD